MPTIEKIGRDAILNVFGPNGERWAKGWGDYEDTPIGEARTCWRGAIRLCSPQPGDGYLIEQVEKARGFDDVWNDRGETRWEDIDRHLNGGIEVSDSDLESTFGPQWREIVSLVRKAASLGGKEAKRLAAAGDAAGDAARSAVRDAALAAAGSAARSAVRDAALAAAGSAARSAVRDAARAAVWAAARSAVRDAALAAAGSAARETVWAAGRDAVWDVALVLCARELIGYVGFTQEHYDTLSAPWRRAIGPIHPEDAELSEDSKTTKEAR